jgi:hypothetical protein
MSQAPSGRVGANRHNKTKTLLSQVKKNTASTDQTTEVMKCRAYKAHEAAERGVHEQHEAREAAEHTAAEQEVAECEY